LESPSPEMKPEMLARVKLFSQSGPIARESGAQGVSKGSGVVLAPKSLLVANGESTRAWVVDQSRGVASLRDVRLGVSGAQDDGMGDGGGGAVSGAWVAVVEGLRPGDRLIAGD